MKDEIVRDEILYTYEAAINRYMNEYNHEWMCRQKKLKEIKKKQKEKREYYCKQKTYGLIIFVLSILLLIFTHELFTILGIIAGVYIIMTKKMVICNEYYFLHDGPEQWKI